MKWIKEVLADAKAVLLAPLTNVLCIAGILLICGSFVDYDKTNGLSLHGQLHRAPAIAGSVLILLGVGIFCATRRAPADRTRLDYEKGVEIRRGELTIHIKTGEIQSINAATRNAAIVLPANTTFVDDCAADKRTAMGAFFLERFPEEVAGLPKLFSDILDSQGIHPVAEGQYAPGTTVVLPDRFAKPAKVVVTASTIRTHAAGITSSPYIICSCVEGVLRCTADQRVDTIYLPILGSGHGGVDRGMAMLFLILATLHYSKTYHHARCLHIVVHPKDVSSLDQSKELRHILAL